MKKNIIQHLEDYNEVLHVLEKNLKYVEQLGMDEGTIQAYRKTLAYLRGRSESEINKILGIKAPDNTSKPKATKAIPKLTDAEFHDLPSSSVLAFISDENLPRSFLEKVAALRFGLTKGGISSLRTREALADKIQRMLDHEATHQSIARAAAGPIDGSTPTPNSISKAVERATDESNSEESS